MLKVAKRRKCEGPRAKGKRLCATRWRKRMECSPERPCVRSNRAMAATRDPVRGSCERRKLATGGRVQRELSKGGRMWEGGESECWQRLWKGESCRGKRKSGRVRRGLPRAAVFQKTAKDEYCRRRPCAEDCERGERRQKQPCATKAATSSRVPEDCGMRLLPKATVCEGCEWGRRRVQKTERGEHRQSDRMRPKSCAKRLREGESCDGQPCTGRLRKVSAAPDGRVWEYGRALPKVTVWKETAKANAGNSGVCGKTAKANGAQQRSWRQAAGGDRRC